MTRVWTAERISWESSVPIFFEKYVLPVLATITTGVVLLNPMKFDWPSRISLFVGVLAFAFLLSHQLHLRNEAIRTGTAPAPKPVEPPSPGETAPSNPPPSRSTQHPRTVQQSSRGANSPNVATGDNNKIEFNSKPEN